MSDERKPISALAGAAWTIVLSLLSALALKATDSIRPGALGDIVNVAVCSVLGMLVTMFIVLRIYSPTSSVRESIGARPVSFGMILLAALIGAALYPPMDRLSVFVERYFPPPQGEIAALTELLQATTLKAKIGLSLSVALILPATDEIFFRGLLFTGIRRGRDAAAAVTATTLLFALAGGEPRAIVRSLVLGFIVGRIRAEAGSVYAPLATHVAYVLVGVVPILRGADPMANLVVFLPLLGGCVFVLVACLFALPRVAKIDARASAARAADGG